MHWRLRAGPPSVAFPSLAFLSESLTLRNYKGSQHPLGSGHQALSAPLQDGLRFFPDELPDVSSVRLAVTLPVAVWTRHSRQPVYHVSCAQLYEPFRSPPSAGGSTFVTGVR